MVKSYLGNPYFGSDRRARIYTTQKGAMLKAKKVKGEVYQIGKGKIFVVKAKGKKYYEK